MNANPILLQKKYARIVQGFQGAASLTTEEALAFFYHSETYQLMRQGLSDMHARSDEYLIEELLRELKQQQESANLAGMSRHSSIHRISASEK